jgi:AmiR/NasT family two-component response regulator
VNLYAREVGAFTEDDLERATPFAGHAAGAVALSMRLAEREDRAHHLGVALRSRSGIDRAIGAVMATLKIDSDAAFDVLRKRSQNNNTLREVAAELQAQPSGRS